MLSARRDRTTQSCFAIRAPSFRTGLLAVLAAGLVAVGWIEQLPAQPPSDTDPAPRVIFDGASVLDGTGAPFRADMAIVTRADTIVAVVPSNELGPNLLEGAEVVDASDWYAIPGLVEAHTHLATSANRARAEFLLNRQLFGGVTTARDMAGDVRSLMDLQRASLVGEIPAPDLHFAALMAGPGFFSDPRTVSSAAGERAGAVFWMQAVTENTDVVEAVTLARGTWASGIKTYAAIEGRLLAAIVAEARRQTIPVWSHTHVGPARALEVARIGPRSMSHVCSVLSAAIPAEVVQAGQEGRQSGFVEVDPAHSAIDSVFAAMQEHGTVLDATLRIVVMNQERASERAADAPPTPQPNPPTDVRRRGVRARCGSADAFALTRRAYEAGVMIATGTDGMTPRDVEYPALHEEIALLHDEVGMSMIDVLRASSHHGAVALGLEDVIGTLERGKQANIVFLREDPLASPASLASVVLTVKRGTRYWRRDFVLGELPG